MYLICSSTSQRLHSERVLTWRLVTRAPSWRAVSPGGFAVPCPRQLPSSFVASLLVKPCNEYSARQRTPYSCRPFRLPVNQSVPYWDRPSPCMRVSARSDPEHLVEVEVPVFSPLNNPFFGYDAINHIMARYIKCRIPGAGEICRDSNLLSIAFNFQAAVR